MNKTPNRGNRIIFLLIRLFNFFSRITPVGIWLFLGRFFGLFFFLVDGPHRRITRINLKFAFGDEIDKVRLRELTRENFHQFGMIGFEWLRILRLTRKDLDRIKERITVQGEEHLIEAKKKSKSVILLGAHFGNWEYAHLYYADTYNRLNFIVRRIDDPIIEEERVAYNRRFGVNILYKENGLRPAIRNLKKGEDLMIFADRKASLSEGIPCRFFNQKTSTISVAVSLSQKYNVPIVPMFIYRCEDMVSHKIVFFPELDIKGLNLTEATQLQNDAIERAIRKHPAQWLWIHRKWKCYHADIYE